MRSKRIGRRSRLRKPLSRPEAAEAGLIGGIEPNGEHMPLTLCPVIKDFATGVELGKRLPFVKAEKNLLYFVAFG